MINTCNHEIIKFIQVFLEHDGSLCTNVIINTLGLKRLYIYFIKKEYTGSILFNMIVDSFILILLSGIQSYAASTGNRDPGIFPLPLRFRLAVRHYPETILYPQITDMHGR